MNGLKPIHEYWDKLSKMYPCVPFNVIKKLERSTFNETELKEKLNALNKNKWKT